MYQTVTFPQGKTFESSGDISFKRAFVTQHNGGPPGFPLYLAIYLCWVSALQRPLLDSWGLPGASERDHDMLNADLTAALKPGPGDPVHVTRSCLSVAFPRHPRGRLVLPEWTPTFKRTVTVSFSHRKIGGAEGTQTGFSCPLFSLK